MENQPLSFQEVEKILRLIDASPKEGTFTIKVDDMKLSVTKGPKTRHTVESFDAPVGMTVAPTAQVAPPVAPVEAQPTAAAAQVVAQTPPVDASAEGGNTAPASAAAVGVVGSGHPVASPLTGVFYRQPSPDAAPFVVEGQAVKAGDVLAIIEVMKLMNRLTAPVSGIIKEIHAENEELIEQGKTLFVIDTSGGAS